MSHLQQIVQFGTIRKTHKNLLESLLQETKDVQQREAAKPKQVKEGWMT